MPERPTAEARRTLPMKRAHSVRSRVVCTGSMAATFMSCAASRPGDASREETLAPHIDAASDGSTPITTASDADADHAKGSARILAIAAGGGSTCFLLEGGTVSCSGVNEVSMSAARESAPKSSSCAILDNGEVKCWGWNWGGKLGLPGGEGPASFRGARPGEMGDRLPAIHLGTGRIAKAIAVGYGSSCAVLDPGPGKMLGARLLRRRRPRLLPRTA
jgi:E3 ubiquitin-protein ligase HERC3